MKVQVLDKQRSISLAEGWNTSSVHVLLPNQPPCAARWDFDVGIASWLRSSIYVEIVSRVLVLCSFLDASLSFFSIWPPLFRKRKNSVSPLSLEQSLFEVRPTARLPSKPLSPLPDHVSRKIHGLESSDGMTAGLDLRYSLANVPVLEPPCQAFGPRRADMATHCNPSWRGSVRR